MIDDFAELRRTALSTGDARDWQRLQRAANRRGLDTRGRSLPEGARWCIPGAEYVLPFKPRFMRYSPSGQWLAVASKTDLQVWDTSARDVVWSATGMIDLVPYWDGSSRFYFKERIDGEVFLRNIDLTKPESDPRDVCCSSEHSEFAFSEAEPMFAQFTSREGVTVYSLEDMSRQCFFQCKKTAIGVGFSRDGRALYWFDHQNSFHSVILASKKRWSCDLPGYFNSERFINGFGESTVLAYYYGTLHEIDWAQQTLKVRQQGFVNDPDPLMHEFSMAMGTDKTHLLTASGQAIAYWELNSQKPIWSIPSQSNPCIAAHHKNDLFAHTSSNKALSFRKVHSGEALVSGPLRSVEWESLHFANSDQWIIINGVDSSFQCLDLQSFDCLCDEPYTAMPASDTDHFYFSAGGRSAIGTIESKHKLGGVIAKVLAYRHRDGEDLLATLLGFGQVRDGEVQSHAQFGAFSMYWSHGCFSPSGRFYFGAGPTLQGDLWDFEENRLLWRRTVINENDHVPHAFFSNDEQSVWTYGTIYARSGPYLASQFCVRQLDVNTGEELGRWTLDKFSAPEAITACATGPLFAWAYPAGEITLRDHQLRELSRFKDPDSKVTALAFSSDGKTLASGSKIGGLTLWDCSPFLQ